jgi:hypothetical protein
MLSRPANSFETRRDRIIATAALEGVPLSVGGDILLFIAQRCLNWLVIQGFRGGINAGWPTGSPGPISIITSPVTSLPHP